MRTSLRYAVAAGAVAVLGLGAGVGPALAASPAHHAAAYSDTDVTALLAFGSGKIAAEHPETVKNLGEKSQPADVKTTSELTAALSKIDPDYHAVVTEGLQSHNPYKVQAALSAYSEDVQTLAKSNNAKMSPNGSWWVWTQQAIVQTGTVATTVAAVAEVGVVAVVAYAHHGDTSAFSQEAVAASVAKSL
ncbi:hypothetical protein AB0A70_10855 [Streptomyces morookaense]|uniref:hypothetical protein n=1 Tax=Streptomyces morookaense TaxID=1970 RepID=UPI0033E2D0D8